MNDLLKDRLSTLDDLLLTAIREVFDENVEKVKPLADTPNSELGEKYRAYLVAQEIINNTFVELASYKTNKSRPANFRKEL
jgi:hypothetical protein